jgi:hypothetical protein
MLLTTFVRFALFLKVFLPQRTQRATEIKEKRLKERKAKAKSSLTMKFTKSMKKRKKELKAKTKK